MAKVLKVALAGNPNTGKSTLFNVLTGLNQKVGNFPGVTVDKKTGVFNLSDGRTVHLMDLPGCYSLYPKTVDERIVFDALTDPATMPEVVVFLADATNLKRNLLLFTQIADLDIPMVLALNMTDLAEQAGIFTDADKLAAKLGVRVVKISARQNAGIPELRQAIEDAGSVATQQPIFEKLSLPIYTQLKPLPVLEDGNEYINLQRLHRQSANLKGGKWGAQEADVVFDSKALQAEETVARYKYIDSLLAGTVKETFKTDLYAKSSRIDQLLTHKVFGYVIFLLILFIIFNSIFTWSEQPMSWIEEFFTAVQSFGQRTFPPGLLTDLIFGGIVPGLGGVLVFIPQIAILFAFISILEDTGYMARVTFIMDKLMNKVGLSGKSVVPLIGGLACAVPSIMAARTIESWKDRMITIMVTPLVSCSARLPVFTLLISLVVPNKTLWGFISLQGLTLMLLYLVGIVSALLVAWVMKVIIKSRDRTYFIMELPVYRAPRWKNVLFTMYDRSKTFVLEAGKIIVAISIILWALATFAPGKGAMPYETDKLEESYIGRLGHAIEPAIRPLGYDWRIGIALLTSFAAREAFVGTMATIYSVGADTDDPEPLRQRMAQAKWQDGTPVYTFASGLSLMMFYVFAMQCMSTLAIVKRETKSWKWPIIQFVYMTGLAYIAALITYQVLK